MKMNCVSTLQICHAISTVTKLAFEALLVSSLYEVINEPAFCPISVIYPTLFFCCVICYNSIFPIVIPLCDKLVHRLVCCWFSTEIYLGAQVYLSFSPTSSMCYLINLFYHGNIISRPRVNYKRNTSPSVLVTCSNFVQALKYFKYCSQFRW